MSLSVIQRQVDEYISTYTNGYFPPLSMLARLTEELGELARALSHQEGFKKPKPGEGHESVEEELCDLLFVAVCLANQQRIDLDRAFSAAMEKYRSRDALRWK
jgi:NTP pyrophosphatase (non-canonical NTP hydrolase)